MLLLGGGPIVEDTGDEVEVEAQTSVADVHVNTTGLAGNASVDPRPSNATEANGSVTANASVGSTEAAAEGDVTQGEVNVSTSVVAMNVRLADGEIVELTYTPATADDIANDLPDTASEDGDDGGPAASEAARAAPDDEDDGGAELAWAIAPASGVAAAAAVSQATPVGRWLRRLLAAAPLAPLYSRIGRQDVLDHETREAIFALLGERPGLSLEAIADELELARSTARHHVRKLEETGMIDHAPVGRARIHHRVGDGQRALRRHLLSNETRAEVFAAIEDEARTITEIAEAIDANPGSVHFHLSKLEEEELVETTDAAGRRYRARPLEDAPEAVFEEV